MHPETLRKRVRQAEADSGRLTGMLSRQGVRRDRDSRQDLDGPMQDGGDHQERRRSTPPDPPGEAVFHRAQVC